MRAPKVGLATVASMLGLSIAAATGCNPGESSTTLGAGGSSPRVGGNAGNGGNSGTGGLIIALPDASPAGGAGGGTTEAVWPPTGYINAKVTSYGGYALGPKPSSEVAIPKPGQCAGLFGVIRDFKMSKAGEGHPDFQTVSNTPDTGIVTDTLGDDGKPVYAHPDGKTPSTTGRESFDQWYRDVDGVNQTFMLGLKFVPNGNVVTFAASLGNTDATVPDSYFFPLDGQGWNDQATGKDGQEHNFAFTTEIHTTFTYNGGETFKFQGDDDVFVYINKHLVIDLGGIHKQKTQTVELDGQAQKLGIEKGNVYELAVFNAERHTTESNFRIDTTMVFENCGTIIL